MRKQKNKSVLVDTNVILRYLLKDVPDLYLRTEGFFARVRTGEQAIEIGEGVLAEVVYVLLKYYRVPKEEVVETLSAFLLYKGMPGKGRSEYLQALRLFGRTGLDFVDCLLVAKAKARKAEVFTFDKDLLRALE